MVSLHRLIRIAPLVGSLLWVAWALLQAMSGFYWPAIIGVASLAYFVVRGRVRNG